MFLTKTLLDSSFSNSLTFGQRKDPTDKQKKSRSDFYGEGKHNDEGFITHVGKVHVRKKKIHLVTNKFPMSGSERG